MVQRLDLFKIPSKLKKRIAKNQTNKKIPKSFHVFNLPLPPQNLMQLGGGGKSSSYRESLYKPEMLQGVWKTTFIHT